MTPLLVFAQKSTYELTTPGNRLPPFLWTAFTTINKIHGIWRWYRRVELYRNPDNLAQLLAGHLVNLAIGDMLLLRVAAQCLLISTRILECAQQQTILHRAGQDWFAAVQGHYPKPYKSLWHKNHQTTWISPSSAATLKAMSASFWNRLKRIAACTAVVFMHLFKLSMNIMDAMDAFCLSPHTRNEGINEGFVNAMKWLDNLVENKEELLNGLSANKTLVEKILQNSPITYTQLHGCVTKTVENTEIVYQNAKKISNFANGVIVDMGKRALLGSMVMIGLSSSAHRITG